MLQDVTDLSIYNQSLQLLEKLYHLLKKVPKSETHLIVQCKKCGSSIPANISEGWAKRSSEKEFKRFLKIAIGSSDELISHLRVVGMILTLLAKEADELGLEYKVLSKRMNTLHKIWKSNNS